MDLSKIPAFGPHDRERPFREKLNPGILQPDAPPVRYEGPIFAEGEIRYAEGEMILRARLSGTRKLVCSRCLVEFDRAFQKDVFLDFEAGGKKSVNALPELGEELLVEEPIQVLCRPDCRGLCPVCGQNRNAGRCGCA